MRSALYEGTLTHVRTRPAPHTFTYRLHQVLLDLDELEQLDRELAWFGVDRRAAVEVRRSDHLGESEPTLKEGVLALLRERGVDAGEIARVELLTNARTLGYVFNPVSFYWCRRADESVRCVVAEVHNTFGERWCYLLEPDARGTVSCAEISKVFHVSPFMRVEGSYRFRLVDPDERAFVRIDHVAPDGEPHFTATLALAREPLTSASLRRALLRQPLLSARITALIHWQAARLALKRVPFTRKPPFDPETGSSPA